VKVFDFSPCLGLKEPALLREFFLLSSDVRQSTRKDGGLLSEHRLEVFIKSPTSAFFFFIFRQARGAQDSIFSFGKSKAKLFAKGKQTIAFKDVAGVDEAKKN